MRKHAREKKSMQCSTSWCFYCTCQPAVIAQTDEGGTRSIPYKGVVFKTSSSSVCMSNTSIMLELSVHGNNLS